MRAFSFLFCLLLLASQSHAAEALVWKTELELGQAVELPRSCVETDPECPDYVAYAEKSRFGPNYYLTYHEGTRASIGFGTAPNEATQVFTAVLHPGGFDWGGTEVKGAFKPLYVIKRFYLWDEEGAKKSGTWLAIFKLTPDGGSCLVETKNEISNNAEARAAADADAAMPRCSDPLVSPKGG
jgi:hypothetical protein